MLQTGNILHSLGRFLPSTYQSSTAHSINLTPTTVTLTIALPNASSVLISKLGDRSLPRHQCHPRLNPKLRPCSPRFLGLANQVALLAVVAITYGFFAGGFSARWSGVFGQMKTEIQALETGLIFGLLPGGRGVGNVISGPLSVALVGKGMDTGGGGMRRSYESDFARVIILHRDSSAIGGLGLGLATLGEKLRQWR